MNELLKKSIKELKELEEKARAELFALRFQAAMGNLERPHRIKELRKEIARILTVLSMHRLAGEVVNVNVKVDLSETYSKIEKESQEFVKKQRAKAEEMMKEQSGQGNDLMDLPLPLDEMTNGQEETTVEQVSTEEKVVAKKPTTTKASSSSKSSSTSKASSSKSTATKSTTTKSKEVKTEEKKSTTVKKSSTASAPKVEKLSAAPASKKGKIAEIEITEAKKDPNAKEFTYGSNWQENKQRIEEATAKDKVKTTTAKKPTKKGADK